MANAKVEARTTRALLTNSHHEVEYRVLYDQRLAVIRSYNMWYAFGHAMAHGHFWLLLVTGLNLSSQPLVFAAAVSATLIVWFAYKAILVIDRGMIWLYPRLIFLEIVLGFHSYRDYLRRRPRGDSERAFIETCEQIHAATPSDLWDQINSRFKERDFPADRRITGHFKWAAFLSVALFWVIIAIILQPVYFPLNG